MRELRVTRFENNDIQQRISEASTEETRLVQAGNEALCGLTVGHVFFAEGFGHGGLLDMDAVEKCGSRRHNHDSKTNPIAGMQADSKKHQSRPR